MKKYIIGMSFLLLAFAGCQDKALNVESVTLSEKDDKWTIDIRYPVFSSSDEAVNSSCALLNQKIQQFIADLHHNTKTEADKLFESIDKEGMDPPNWKYELYVKDSVFMAAGKYISVRLLAYSFTGGAHGMTRFYTFNYDVKNQKLLTNDDIFNKAEAAEVNTQLKTKFNNPSNCLSTVPTLELASVVNFNRNDVCFTYEHYVLGAYACGYYETSVPRKELKRSLLLK
ncbi:MAG: DUF4163 domain-containing protein [Bacteroidales bacterium]|jgi:hypothetical protein|nr:DUF4163 domain-containing protein [Bacteroidales bacterium]